MSNIIFYSRDNNIPTITLFEYDLETENLDDDLIIGVMSVLFAPDIAAARQAMSTGPMSVRKGLDKLNRLFFTPESVDLKGAFRKPRLGEAVYMFKERLFDTPARTGQQTGKCLLKRK